MPTQHTSNTNKTRIFFSEISRLFAYLVGKISYSWRGENLRKPRRLVNLFQFVQQFPFQILPRGFSDRAPLRRDRLLLRLPLSARAHVDLARQMRNLWSLCADFSFAGFRVRIHGLDTRRLALSYNIDSRSEHSTCHAGFV